MHDETIHCPEPDVERLCTELAPIVAALHVESGGEGELMRGCTFTVKGGRLQFRGSSYLSLRGVGFEVVHPQLTIDVTDTGLELESVTAQFDV